MDKKALHDLTYGLFIIAAKNDTKQSACVINTAIQVSSDPILLSVAISKNNYTHDLLLSGGKCTISILSEAASMDTIRHFGFQSGSEVDKFADFPYKLAKNSVPFIANGTTAYFAGTVKQSLDIGTHTLFIIAVDEMENLSDDTPMSYNYYRQVKKGTSPKNAPTYEAVPASNGWRCSVCGYTTDIGELPADFTCPVCKQPKEVFQKV